MPQNDDFDLSSLFQGPGAVLAGVLGVADNARKTVGGVMETIAALQRAAVAVEALVTRLQTLADDLEAPLRALTPEIERTIGRVQRVSAALEGPIDRLLPGLESAVGTFDRVALSQLPETVDEARQQLQTLLDLFGEIPRRLGMLGGRSGLGALLPLGRLVDSRPATHAASPKKTAASPAVAPKALTRPAGRKATAVKKSATKAGAKSTKVGEKVGVKQTAAKRGSAGKKGTSKK